MKKYILVIVAFAALISTSYAQQGAVIMKQRASQTGEALRVVPALPSGVIGWDANKKLVAKAAGTGLILKLIANLTTSSSAQPIPDWTFTLPAGKIATITAVGFMSEPGTSSTGYNVGTGVITGVTNSSTANIFSVGNYVGAQTRLLSNGSSAIENTTGNDVVIVPQLTRSTTGNTGDATIYAGSFINVVVYP